ncbi:MAG TPA: hypothetical protein VFW94_05180 [Candidatus Acidoferrales bacterium]|nr:hypothetical protein [Candidatus Acidoferrales bacterium]
MQQLQQHLAFGGGAGQTVLGPAVLVALIIAVVLMFVLPRKYVIIPFFIALFLSPAGQEVYIGGVHLFVTRILILSGWIRLIASKLSGRKIWTEVTALDKVFFVWAVCRVLAFLIRYPQSGAVVYQAGFLIDALGGFFLIRALIRDDEDVDRVIKLFAAITVVLAITMGYEELTGVNVFGLIGHVVMVPDLRNGRVRAMGPFEHPLLAGAFTATLVPLFFWLWKSGRSKFLAILGVVSASIAGLTTQCSTPILGYGAAVLALCFWPFRKQMRMVRWGIVGTLVGLQIVMKANVWWIIQHFDLIGGSSGWHRAELVDVFLKAFPKWWLIGTSNNANWGFMTWDTLNQYVQQGEQGGLLAFVLFIALICIGFSWLGKARKSAGEDRTRQWYFWALGSALFAHVITYFGVSYFDQTKFAWYALLAIIVAATGPLRSAKTVPQEDTSVPAVRRSWVPAARPAEPVGLLSNPRHSDQARSRAL